MTVTALLQKLKAEWATPRGAEHRGKSGPFRLKCSFAETGESDMVLNRLSVALPSEFEEFWKSAATARLFEDVDYGQWGLEIVSPAEAESLTRNEFEKRPLDYLPGDLVVGRFLGDSDLLLVRCDQSASDFGSVVMALPIDKRPDWDVVAKDFADFLTELVEADGDKFWEVRH